MATFRGCDPIEIDEQLGNFRYRHLQMVRRMIGSRVGTGGSSGEQYLQGAVNRNYIFKELPCHVGDDTR